MHRRIPIGRVITFEGDARGSAELIEMSEGGLSFRCAMEIATGSRLQIRIEDAGEVLAVEGKIVYAHPRAGRVQYGLQFYELLPATLAAVKAFLKRHRFAKFRVPT